MIREVWEHRVVAAFFFWALASAPNLSAAQSGAPTGQAESLQRPAVSAPAVTPDTPVITIKGPCPQIAGSASASSAECTTVITRAEFEGLVQALRADKDPETRQQLVTAYPQILILAHEAEQRGLDKEQRVQERLSFGRLQILSQELVAQIREQAAQVPAKDIEDYYRQNAQEFEEVNLERIVIPNHARTRSGGPGATQADPNDDSMTRLAEVLRTRAASGESFSKLQKEAYDAAGLSGNTEPNPRMDKMRRRSLPLGHASVFELKPGEVSPVISDQTGHYVYKVESKEVETIEEAKPEISSTLRQQRLQKMMQQIEQPFTIDVNHTYFGTYKHRDDD